MGGELREAGAARDRIGRRRLVHGEDVPHETPAHEVGQVGELAEEARGFHPAVGVHARQPDPAHAELHPSGPGLERRRRVVEGGGAGAQHADALARQSREIDGFRGVAPAGAGQIVFDEIGDMPGATAGDAGREHDLAGEQHLAAVGGGRQQVAVRLDRHHAGVVAHRQVEHMAIPVEIVLPALAGDFAPSPARRLRRSGPRTRRGGSGCRCRDRGRRRAWACAA